MTKPAHIPPPRQRFVNRLIWMVLGISLAADLWWIKLSGLSLTIRLVPVFAFLFGICALVSLVQRYICRDEALYLFGETIAQTILASFIIMVSLLMGARFNRPLIDDTLIAADRLLGLDWHSYVMWVDQQPIWFNQFMTFAYESYGLQAMILISMLFIRHHSAHAQRFVIVFYLTGMITMLLASIWPAVAAYIYYDFDTSQFQHLHTNTARIHQPELMAMRNHTTDVIIYPGVGIVTFPSFHTVMSVLMIYLSWPFKYFRWPIIALNIGMLMATPSHGGHYFVDMLGGFAIIALGIYIAERILPRQTKES